MMETLLANLARRNWLLDGPLLSIVPYFIETLRDQRYSEYTVSSYLRCLAHFSFWAKTQEIELHDVNTVLVDRFLNIHIPVCTCPSPRKCSIHELRAALRHLLRVLPPSNQTYDLCDPINQELAQFKKYLIDICGVAHSTWICRTQRVEAFLRECSPNNHHSVELVSADDIERFILGLAGSKRWKPSSLRVVSSHLRSYLRFRSLRGDSVTTHFSALPRVARHKDTTLPQTLSDHQLETVLRSFDSSDPTGARDYAIARCLVDLGLRGQEVAQLTLDAIDWRRGIVAILGNKSKRVQQLPLPASMGEAIVAYLQRHRPQTASRVLFARHVAPYDKPLSVAAIRNTMNRAFIRSGMGDLFCSTHIFRHTTASRLQKSGIPLKQIADVMRHQNLDTTIRYAKVDIDSLRTVALPWPGSAA